MAGLHRKNSRLLRSAAEGVKQQFRAERPNALRVSDFTYVSTWHGFVYVAFVIYVFARRIVGWKVSSSARTDFVLDALEQALHARRPAGDKALTHHSDRGVQCVWIRYTERLADAGIESSVGSVGDSYENALTETINWLFKAELIHRRSWRNLKAAELAALDWVDWFNNKRLLGRSATSHPQKQKTFTINSSVSLPWRRGSQQRVSRIPERFRFAMQCV